LIAKIAMLDARCSKAPRIFLLRTGVGVMPVDLYFFNFFSARLNALRARIYEGIGITRLLSWPESSTAITINKD
jgi:hypothetical protein